MINRQHGSTQRKARKYRILFPLLVILALVASACGNSTGNTNKGTANTGDNATATASPQPAATTAPDAFKTVTTINGEIEIPAEPKRIVAEEYLGSLIALGTIPVGAPGLTLENVYFKEALAGVTDTGTYGKMSPENIIALEPDLIISGMADSYETLSQIAPTVIVPYGDLKNAHEELTYFGELLGRNRKPKTGWPIMMHVLPQPKPKWTQLFPRMPPSAFWSMPTNPPGLTATTLDAADSQSIRRLDANHRQQ